MKTFIIAALALLLAGCACIDTKPTKCTEYRKLEKRTICIDREYK